MHRNSWFRRHVVAMTEAFALLPMAALSVTLAGPPAGRGSEQDSVRVADDWAGDSEPSIYTAWKPRRYLEDKREFLVKFKEIVAEIEVFPFQWIAFPGARAGDFLDNWYVDHRDSQWFYHFADLARCATTEDLKACLDYLPEATPKERALLLIVLHFSLDDGYLPVIATYTDDYSEPFPRLSEYEDTKDKWGLRRARRCMGEKSELAQEVRRKNNEAGELNFFEARVLGGIQRFRFLYLGVPSNAYAARDMAHVGNYALAILRLRGCGLVKSMRRMAQLRDVPSSPSLLAEYEKPLTAKTLFTAEAWNEFRSLRFDVRRLHQQYLLQVECVSPPYQEEAASQFMKKLEMFPARTVALACFSVSTSVLNALEERRVLVRDWAEYVRRIPKEQVVELLTSDNLGAIDATLAFEPQVETRLGYRPYFGGFLVYVLKHRAQWFDDAEFASIEARLNVPAQGAWKRVQGSCGRPG